VQRSGAQAVDIVTKIDVGQITLKDFIFRQACFHPESDQHFASLAGQAALWCEEGKLGELLRNRAAALCHAAASGIAPCRTRKAARVDAPMRIEPPVFDREKGIDDMIGQFCDLYRLIYNGAVARNRLAIRGEQGNLRRCDRLQGF
jgi:hypothetical protein